MNEKNIGFDKMNRYTITEKKTFQHPVNNKVRQIRYSVSPSKSRYSRVLILVLVIIGIQPQYHGNQIVDILKTNLDFTL